MTKKKDTSVLYRDLKKICLKKTTRNKGKNGGKSNQSLWKSEEESIEQGLEFYKMCFACRTVRVI